MKIGRYIAGLMLGTTMALAGTYSVDLDHSHLEFKVKHLMISNVKGTFKNFEGSFAYNEKSNILEALKGKVDVNSINTHNEKRDAHLKSIDFFNAAKFPTMELELLKADIKSATASLTIRGVTKNVVFELENSEGAIKDPWGGMRRGLTLTTTINRSDFGLKWNQLIESGGVAVGEKVKISIELEGVLQK